MIIKVDLIAVLLIIGSMFTTRAFPDESGENIQFRHIAGEYESRVITEPESEEDSPMNHAGAGIGKEYRPSLYSPVDFAASLVWTLSDAAAIVNRDIGITGEGDLTAMAFNLNDERFSLFQFYHADTIWEYPTGADGYLDIAEEGNRLAAAANDMVYLFLTDSARPYWKYPVSAGFRAGPVDISTDGAYLAASAISGDTINIILFAAANPSPLWIYSIDPYESGGLVSLKIPTSKSKLLVTCRNMIYLINMISVDLIWSTEAFNTEYPADISGDEAVIVVGSITNGMLRTFQWNSVAEDYTLIWTYNFTGGTSAWARGIAISDDGSTILAGSLIFYESGYGGEVACFSTYEGGVPRWTYSGMGDAISDVALSSDGLIGIAGSWGDIANTTPDIALFETYSPVPFFTAISPGSINGVDISAEGKYAVAGGKAVHNRVFGNGARVYGMEINLGGGFISGQVNLSDDPDNSGVLVETVGFPRFALTDEDGKYLIKYIPAGEYLVTAQKRGYNTDVYPEIIVFEMDTTEDIDFELTPVGVALRDLAASAGLLTTVELDWVPLEPGTSADTILIYRAQVPGGPYNLIGKAGALDSAYSDRAVFPTFTYYYVITARYPDGESEFSNEAMGFLDDSYIITEIIVPIAEITPILDGGFAPDEWEDAIQVDISDVFGSYDGIPNGPGSIYLYLKYCDSLDLLYLAAENLYDHGLSAGEGMGIYIDDNCDGRWTDSGSRWHEGNFWLNFESGHRGISIFRQLTRGGWAGYQDTLDDITLRFSTIAGRFQMEASIPMGFKNGHEIQLFAPEKKIGFGAFLQRFHTGTGNTFEGWWPQGLDNIVSYPNHFGTLTIPATLYAPPAAPESIRVETVDENDLQISWIDPDLGVDGFPLLRLSGLIIYRNGVAYSFEDSGVELFRDEDLTMNAWYQYALQGYSEVDLAILMGDTSGYYGSFVGSTPDMTCLSYSDSTSEAYYVVSFSWDQNKFAVRFEPPFYPCMVRQIDFMSNNYQGVELTIADDSTGLPGSALAGPFEVSPAPYEWTSYLIPGREPPVLGDGTFWAVINFREEHSGYPGIGVDYGVPLDSNSYSFTAAGGWSPFLAGDLMIRACISIPTSVSENPPVFLPARCWLYPNYPNPFNSITAITIDLSQDGFKSLQGGLLKLPVFNIRGEKVQVLTKKPGGPGRYNVIWDGIGADGKIMPSGVYFYQVKIGEFTAGGQMLLLR
ncbi:carboxypeptidase regulatory-like domain-containing protein [bacterium]|nr:carboxypeptidase regulatory-like domain-containing protein [bacterium]